MATRTRGEVMPFDPNDELTVKLPAAEWNQWLATYQEGIIRTLAPLVNDPTRTAGTIQQVQNQLQQLFTKVSNQLQSQGQTVRAVKQEASD